MPLTITDILNRRGDLSTFLVHLTRDQEKTAADNLKSILTEKKIFARSIYGHLRSRAEKNKLDLPSQKTVCFTETPLEFTHLLVEEIADRDYKFAPYGIALTKRVARERAVNPVWYLDMSPGHKPWLTVHFDHLAERFLDDGGKDEDMAKVFPFIEHMGNGPKTAGGGYRKEFWWEREWRHIGDFKLPATVICLCPEGEIDSFRSLMQKQNIKGSCIDPRWSLEKIIAYLGGFSVDEIDTLRKF